jgi:hypothetical protein
MTTFREFFNRRERMPISGRTVTTKPPSMGTMAVVKDFGKFLQKPSINPETPDAPTPEKAPLPTEIGLRPTDRTIAKKPTDFLPRKGSSFKNF